VHQVGKKKILSLTHK